MNFHHEPRTPHFNSKEIFSTCATHRKDAQHTPSYENSLDSLPNVVLCDQAGLRSCFQTLRPESPISSLCLNMYVSGGNHDAPSVASNAGTETESPIRSYIYPPESSRVDCFDLVELEVCEECSNSNQSEGSTNNKVLPLTTTRLFPPQPLTLPDSPSNCNLCDSDLFYKKISPSMAR
jgi:hypothetical protein